MLSSSVLTALFPPPQRSSSSRREHCSHDDRGKRSGRSSHRSSKHHRVFAVHHNIANTLEGVVQYNYYYVIETNFQRMQFFN